MFSFVLWAWLNNTAPALAPVYTSHQTSASSGLPDWRPRDLCELLAADSPLTLDKIRNRLRVPCIAEARAPGPPPVPYIPLMMTPNQFIPDEDEELLQILMM